MRNHFIDLNASKRKTFRNMTEEERTEYAERNNFDVSFEIKGSRSCSKSEDYIAEPDPDPSPEKSEIPWTTVILLGISCISYVSYEVFGCRKNERLRLSTDSVEINENDPEASSQIMII